MRCYVQSCKEKPFFGYRPSEETLAIFPHAGGIGVYACKEHINPFRQPWYNGMVFLLNACAICQGFGDVDVWICDGIEHAPNGKRQSCKTCDGSGISQRARNWFDYWMKEQ